MAVADLLVTALAAHRRAHTARTQHDSAGNQSALTTARAALRQARTLDPDYSDPAWQTLPCPVSDLQAFYAQQLKPGRPMSPRARLAQRQASQTRRP